MVVFFFFWRGGIWFFLAAVFIFVLCDEPYAVDEKNKTKNVPKFFREAYETIHSAFLVPIESSFYKRNC